MKRGTEVVSGVIFMVWSIFSSASEYPKARFGEEEGFVDISLSIAKYEKTQSGSRRFLIKNSLNDKKISFAVELLPAWDAKAIENTESHFYWGRANLMSVGTESDAFITVLTELYGRKPENLKFKDTIPVQVVGLANNPEDVELAPVKMKFFLNPDAEEDLYSEIFINIDLKNKRLEFNEKDPEYRAPLVRSIAQ